MTEDEDPDPGGVYDPRDALPVEGPVTVESYDPELDQPVRVVRVPARALATVGVLLVLTVVGVGFAHRGHGVTAPVAASASTGGGLPPLFITPTAVTSTAAVTSRVAPAPVTVTSTVVAAPATRTVTVHDRTTVTTRIRVRIPYPVQVTSVRTVTAPAAVIHVTATRTVRVTITRRVR